MPKDPIAVTPDSIPEPEITSDAARALMEHRRQQALAREAEAVQVELHVRQWTKFAAAVPTFPGVENQRLQNIEAAARARRTAEAMHELAGTTPDDARDTVVRSLESQKFFFESHYIGALDAQAHPLAYGEMQQPPELYAAGLQALNELLSEWSNRKKLVKTEKKGGEES